MLCRDGRNPLHPAPRARVMAIAFIAVVLAVLPGLQPVQGVDGHSEIRVVQSDPDAELNRLSFTIAESSALDSDTFGLVPAFDPSVTSYTAAARGAVGRLPPPGSKSRFAAGAGRRAHRAVPRAVPSKLPASWKTGKS